jgi:hypothetical protein
MCLVVGCKVSLLDLLRNYTNKFTQNWLLERPKIKLNVPPSEAALSFDVQEVVTHTFTPWGLGANVRETS